MVDQAVGFVRAAFVLIFRQDRHESLGEGPLGEHAAQQVGESEGDDEGVHLDAGAKGAGLNEVAHKTQDPRQQGHAADRGEGRGGGSLKPFLGDRAGQKRGDVSGLLRCAAMRFSLQKQSPLGRGARPGER